MKQWQQKENRHDNNRPEAMTREGGKKKSMEGGYSRP